MRSRLRKRECVVAQNSFIPAYGEQTHSQSGDAARLRLHPRLRGTDFPILNTHIYGRASSPPTGNRRDSDDSDDVIDGFIPAYGGQTKSGLQISDFIKLHPRIRGTDLTLILALIDHIDSSPPTGSRPACCGSFGVLFGFIPARGEQTFQPGHFSDCFELHPRPRGTDKIMTSCSSIGGTHPRPQG